MRSGRVETLAASRREGFFCAGSQQSAERWSGEAWAERSLQGLPGNKSSATKDMEGHLASIALEGRTADPFLRGSALQPAGAGLR